MCFANHLNSLLLIYLILMSKRIKRIILFKNMLFLKCGSYSERFRFFLFYFNLSNKIPSTPTRLLNFQEFPPCLFQRQTPGLLSFEEFFNPSFY